MRRHLGVNHAGQGSLNDRTKLDTTEQHVTPVRGGTENVGAARQGQPFMIAVPRQGAATSRRIAVLYWVLARDELVDDPLFAPGSDDINRERWPCNREASGRRAPVKALPGRAVGCRHRPGWLPLDKR